MEYICRYNSPLGWITMKSDGESLTGLWFECQRYFPKDLPEARENGAFLFEDARRWLDIYFGGQIPPFTPKLRLNGSQFRQLVWRILLTIPYGQTMTYGEIARIVADECGVKRMSAQAVGSAVGHNPISVIVPCHRVLGAGGSLTGYAGGIERKKMLLEMERMTKTHE